MIADELKSIVLNEINGNWNISNKHHIVLKECLVEPEIRTYLYIFNKFKKITLWLVLEEDPINQNGHEIIFNEQTSKFGLALSDVSRPGMFIGYYGTFLETLKAMN